MDTQIKMENDGKINMVKEGTMIIMTQIKMIEDRAKGLKMIAKGETDISTTLVPVRYCSICVLK